MKPPLVNPNHKFDSGPPLWLAIVALPVTLPLALFFWLRPRSDRA